MGFKKFLKKAVGFAMPVIGFMVGGPAGAAAGAALSTKYRTGSFRGAARNAALAYGTAWAGSALANSGNSASAARAASNAGIGGGSNTGLAGIGGYAGSGAPGYTTAASSGSTLSSLGTATSTAAPVVNSTGTNGVIGTTTGGGTQLPVSGSQLSYLGKDLALGAAKYGTAGLQVANAYGSYQAQQAYEELANNLAAGSAMSPQALAALQELEANPEAWLNSPEVVAARERALDVVKRQASGSVQTYSGNLLAELVKQSNEIDLGMLSARRDQLANWTGVGNPNMSLAALNAQTAAQNQKRQTIADLTTVGRDIFGKEAIGA